MRRYLSTAEPSPRHSSLPAPPLRRSGDEGIESGVTCGARRPQDVTLVVSESSGEALDWNVDRPRYIALLKEFDHNRDPKRLAEFINTEPWEKR